MIDRVVSLTSGVLSAALRRPLLWALPVLAAALGFGAGSLISYAPENDIVDALRSYEPSVVTRIYDRDGMQYAEWLQERREVVTFDEIAPVMVSAVVATEDARFFDHVGIDPWAVFRSVIANLQAGSFEEGFSTITMQIPRNLDRYLGGDTWLPKDKNVERKIREALYAIQIERHYAKEQIFAIYANQIFMGHDVHGFQSASRYYFGKPISDVSLPEAALLAGMIQRPNPFNPYVHPEAAVAKRNVVLGRMLDEGMITAAEAEGATSAPLVLAESGNRGEIGSYFTEEIRKSLIKLYGVQGIYRSGLEVYTTLDRELQGAAEKALEHGLRDVDRISGWRGAPRNLRAEGIEEITYQDPRWADTIEPDDVVPALVTDVTARSARLRVGSTLVELGTEQAEWTGQQNLSRLLEPGDLVDLWVKEIAEDGLWTVELDQEPVVQGAVLVVANNSGEVTALVGGRGFDESEFNRATQAVRQTGSIFKPFAYAAAVALGVTPSELFVDEPHTFRDASTRQPYQPGNFGDEYIGITSMGEALTKSRNVPTVKLQEKIGVQNVIDMARRFGLNAPFGPYLSLSLGVMDISVWEIVRAYTVFPNQGVLVEPHLLKTVYDRRGRLLQQANREAKLVMEADDAYVMARLLVAGVKRGTGVRANPLASELDLMLGGKSGTTDDRTDVWYVGFSPNHTVGVWVGNDLKERIHRNATGSNTALPIWIDVMRAAESGSPPATLPQPANIELRSVDPYTGLLHGPFCTESVQLAYVAGTGPTRACGQTEHSILALPSFRQAYFINNGRIDTGSRD